MIQLQGNNNYSPLPFYTQKDEMNHRRSYAYGEVYPLYTPLGSVPPFQIIRPHNSASVSTATLHLPDGTQKGNIKSALDGSGLKVQQYAQSGYDIVIFPSLAPMAITTEEGRYYIRLSMSDGTVYYSDIFTVTGITGGLLAIQWYDFKDLVMDNGRIAYTDANGVQNYRNILYLNTQLGKPEYTFEEEGEQRDGYFFLEKIISEKTYKCVILASEYLCDVMRFIRMSDVVFIRDQFGNTYRADTFLINPTWQDQGDVASVEIEFTCDTVAKKIGRGVEVLGGFNDDYNNDYDITNVTN
jgi:hypothetical protein